MTCTWAKLSPMAVAEDLIGTTRTVNALGLCDLFIFVWWQDRQSEDLELLVVLATGPSLERVCVFLHFCSQDRMPKHVHTCACVVCSRLWPRSSGKQSCIRPPRPFLGVTPS